MAVIARVTRALVTTADDVIPELVAERRAMREELQSLRRARTSCHFFPPRVAPSAFANVTAMARGDTSPDMLRTLEGIDARERRRHGDMVADRL
jgi:hypothetical protein